VCGFRSIYTSNCRQATATEEFPHYNHSTVCNVLQTYLNYINTTLRWAGYYAILHYALISMRSCLPHEAALLSASKDCSARQYFSLVVLQEYCCSAMFEAKYAEVSKSIMHEAPW